MSPGPARVMLALVQVYGEQGRATVREVAACAGFGVATTHDHLATLAEVGLATWEPGRTGTLRPLFRLAHVT